MDIYVELKKTAMEIMEYMADQYIVIKLKMYNTNLTEAVKDLTEKLGVVMSAIQQLTKFSR